MKMSYMTTVRKIIVLCIFLFNFGVNADEFNISAVEITIDKQNNISLTGRDKEDYSSLCLSCSLFWPANTTYLVVFAPILPLGQVGSVDQTPLGFASWCLTHVPRLPSGEYGPDFSYTPHPAGRCI